MKEHLIRSDKLHAHVYYLLLLSIDQSICVILKQSNEKFLSKNILQLRFWDDLAFCRNNKKFFHVCLLWKRFKQFWNINALAKLLPQKQTQLKRESHEAKKSAQRTQRVKNFIEILDIVDKFLENNTHTN